MPYFYLITSIFCIASANILGTLFNRRNENRAGLSPIYNFYLLCSVFLCWLMMFLRDGTFDWGVLPYALLFALCYTVCNIGLINALKLGSVMLTSLFGQFSLILVSVWGFFFWGAPFTITVGIGLLLTAVALWLCLYSGKSGEKTGFHFKWLLYVLLYVGGNAGCSIVQRTQQMQFEGKYGNFLMMIASAISALVCLVLFLRADRRDVGIITRTSWYLPVLAGALNALLNLFVILMAGTALSPSLIYPVLAIGSLIVITVFSLLVFKEKMRWWQWLGVALGIAATGILSL